MAAKLNLIGERFGRLVVIAPALNHKGKTAWKCKCDCGGEYEGTTASLRSGRLQSCGCLRTETARRNGMKQLNDLTNQRFGQLLVLEYAGSERNRSTWKCKCDCGQEIIVNQMELSRGDTLSCGCLRSSYGEKRIEQILQEQQLCYKKEYSFPDLVSKNNIPLRFDFAIFNSNNELQYLIEYDGEQHYQSKTDNIWTDTKEQRQERDQLKNNYVLSHNILLYRIPYWIKNNLDFNTITSEKFLIKTT